MAGKTKYTSPPARPENGYIRAARAAANLTQEQLAERLVQMGVGSYDKSIVGKMERARNIMARELNAVFLITGHPFPPELTLPASPSAAENIARITQVLERIQEHPHLVEQLVSFSEMLELAAQGLEKNPEDASGRPPKDDV